jgi:hypothetical protein
MESDPVTFAGYGDPLLRLSAVEAAAKAIKHRRHGAQLRVMTNGEGERERERENSHEPPSPLRLSCIAVHTCMAMRRAVTMIITRCGVCAATRLGWCERSA